ncbi:MAG: hypothetical protein JGK12_07780 [Microcoleus sp. PH2017_01_SCD_O_A]|uniref:hypothetical protein n=1 Tax=unclassified Microcoleus TaxID=2642155 RepID=UPI001DC561CA|nr:MULTISPECIES: hypothetical protein [unclassified Microcoleus]MCC3416490.1 hypothetical protein [Microcoleus sp. PH2017_07_MST_O_A]MCC3423820.1 hypothetical protein [Microcoleus sp. PH2017_01_SCD_O_A]MCC3507793.1 hypothetical protein [Microcoleus sp. PH2017_17_BER_D_A]MCC3635421.1 hypothetical protein [Microcoleus sp. PH2017_37_MFU_D_B]
MYSSISNEWSVFESRHPNCQIWHDCRELTQFAANPCRSFADRDQESPNAIAYHPQKTKLAQQGGRWAMNVNGRQLL